MFVVILESPLDCKVIKSVNPAGNNPDYSLERQILRLKLKYFGHIMKKEDFSEYTQILRKI